MYAYLTTLDAVIVKCAYMSSALAKTLSLFEPLCALGFLLRWQAHLVLHYTDQAQLLGQNSCLLHLWHLHF